MMRGGAAFVVTDSVYERHALALAKDLGIRAIPIVDLKATDLRGDPNVVFALDLRSIDTVRHLKTVLAVRGTGCRIFLTDPNIRVHGVHAQVLGADAILTNSGTAREVEAVWLQHFGIKQDNDPSVGQSIKDGVNALDTTFRSLTEGTTLDTDSVLNAGSRIADAIQGVGADEWLATVKGYHMGTFQHCMLVTGVAAGFGTRTGMARRDVVMLTTTGLLHDIGKATVPVAILDKPGALNEAENLVMRQHPVTGYDYLLTHSTVSTPIRNAVRHHHEFLDGSGYPDKLRGSEIDDLTRIMTICDIYAALVERRSYKPAKTPEQAIGILEAMAETGKVETSLVREMRRIMLPR